MDSSTASHTSSHSDTESAADVLGSLFANPLPATEEAAETAGNLTRSLLRHPMALANRSMRMANEQLKILAGTSTVEPDRKDRRFGDEAWTSNPLYRRLGQSYLTWEREVRGLVDDLEFDGMDQHRAELLTDLMTSAASPTNSLLGNPAALRELKRTRGRSLARGLSNAVGDVRHNGAMPSMVDTKPFVAGETVATTPGAVVFTNPILEVIQYQPTTPKVRARPIMILPPQINKYYVLDLGPGRSLAEFAVSQGYQVFMVSWRNPTAEHAAWDLDAYVEAVTEASDAVLEITGQKDLNVLGVCAGGMTTAALIAHLQAIGDPRIRSASFLVTVLDWAKPTTIGSILSGPTVELSRRQSEAKGILEGEDLKKLFAWLRPNDLVWNYWVNNYLMGKDPNAFDVLAWNVDSTNLPAGLHADFLDIVEGNALREAGAVEVLGQPLDLGSVTCPNFVVGAVTDHITPWEACYETVNLLGGKSEFVLSSQGHIQALVNPSGNPKGRYHTNPKTPTDPDTWLEGATEHPGSWWDHWAVWLKSHAGRLVNAPTELGSEANPATLAAPGRYVLD